MELRSIQGPDMQSLSSYFKVDSYSKCDWKLSGFLKGYLNAVWRINCKET